MQIIFEDEQLLAVNKPSGTPSNRLSESSITTPSVEEQLSRQYAPKPPVLLHRLDVGTSGVLLFARDLNTFEQMRALFRQRKIRKSYWAWSMVRFNGELPADLTLPLAHHPKSKKRMVAVMPDRMGSRSTFYRGNPLPAMTKIQGVQEVKWQGQKLFRYDVEIITGVMHQIRVHLSHLGVPLVGDPIYGLKIEGDKTAPAFPRLGLHAHRVEFKLGDYLYQIEAPAP